VRTGIEGDNGDWQVMAVASDEDDAVLILSLFPQKCPAQRRAPCAELLARIDFGLVMGCFEMDYDSGKIHFKTTLPFARGDLNVALLENVVMLNLARMDRFLPAIMSVIYTESPLPRRWRQPCARPRANCDPGESPRSKRRTSCGGGS